MTPHYYVLVNIHDISAISEILAPMNLMEQSNQSIANLFFPPETNVGLVIPLGRAQKRTNMRRG